MEAIIQCASGLDGHESSVLACVITGAARRRTSRQTRTFGAMKRDLVSLRGWLLDMGITHDPGVATPIGSWPSSPKRWRRYVVITDPDHDRPIYSDVLKDVIPDRSNQV